MSVSSISSLSRSSYYTSLYSSPIRFTLGFDTTDISKLQYKSGEITLRSSTISSSSSLFFQPSLLRSNRKKIDVICLSSDESKDSSFEDIREYTTRTTIQRKGSLLW